MSEHIKSSDCNCHAKRATDELSNYGYDDLVPKTEPRIVGVTPYGYEEEPTVPHYDAKGKIRVWDFIADKELDFFEGNVVKYVCRSPYKGEQIEDLEKAINYLQKKIKLVREQRSET